MTIYDVLIVVLPGISIPEHRRKEMGSHRNQLCLVSNPVHIKAKDCLQYPSDVEPQRGLGMKPSDVSWE